MERRRHHAIVLLNGRCFYRAVRTAGFFDSMVVRTIDLTFPEANWQTLLTANYNTGSNLLATLALGGTNYPGVGVRYRGNTSYTQSGAKKSLNIEINATNADARLMAYKTINLNNAAGDNTIMREPIYFNAMQTYAVCPKATFAKLYINGAFWGVYSCVQQEDGQLIKQWFPSNDGDRWRAANMAGQTGGTGVPGGGGGYALSGSGRR
jgi:spore coat protein CotH